MEFTADSSEEKLLRTYTNTNSGEGDKFGVADVVFINSVV